MSAIFRPLTAQTAATLAVVGRTIEQRAATFHSVRSPSDSLVQFLISLYILVTYK